MGPHLFHPHVNLIHLFVPGFFADDKSAAQTEFLKAASALRDKYRFAHTNSEALLQSHGVDGEWVTLSASHHPFCDAKKSKPQMFDITSIDTVAATRLQWHFLFRFVGKLSCSAHHNSAASLKTAQWNTARTNTPATKSRSSSRTTCECSLNLRPFSILLQLGSRDDGVFNLQRAIRFTVIVIARIKMSSSCISANIYMHGPTGSCVLVEVCTLQTQPYLHSVDVTEMSKLHPFTNCLNNLWRTWTALLESGGYWQNWVVSFSLGKG